jgi:hypothetical protein
MMFWNLERSKRRYAPSGSKNTHGSYGDITTGKHGVSVGPRTHQPAFCDEQAAEAREVQA